MNLQAGDMIAFWGSDLLSVVISLLTFGPSHVGIVTEWEGGVLIVESTTLADEPCAIRGEVASGAQAHWLPSRISDYDGRVAVYRLRHHWRLSTHESQLMTDLLVNDFVSPSATYDLKSAIISGCVVKWSHLLPYPDDGSVFCSELCAIAYMRLGRMRLGDAERYNPASLVRSLRRCGVVEKREWIK